MQRAIKFPRAIKRGDKVAIVTPSGPLERALLVDAKAFLEERGLLVEMRSDADSRFRYLAGSDDRRVEELTRVLRDPEIKAIFLARGGYGTQRIIPRLPLGEDIEPKVVVGFSDNTALLGAFREIAGWATLHGPHIRRGTQEEVADSEELLSCLGLFGEAMRPIFEGLTAIKGGKVVEAPVCGGCLSLLSSSIGTPYGFKMEGHILFIEEVGEYPYRIDRMLWHLINSSALDGVRAVVFGELKAFLPEGIGVNDIAPVIEEFAEAVDLPVLTGLPCGHVTPNRTLPFGPIARLDPSNGSLEFLEPAVL